MAFKPKFYWTGDLKEDSIKINKPHIEKEGENENRIHSTYNIMNKIEDYTHFTIRDVFNIQNYLLKENNWKGIIPGYRRHNVKFDDTPDFLFVKNKTEKLFPVYMCDKKSLLKWYKDIQTVHPLSDLNGRVFGIIISILWRNYKKKKGE